MGDIEIDFEARRIVAEDKQIRLTTKEFDLLFYLAAHPNKTITHRELLREVWGPDYGGEQEYLRVFVNRLRKKIEALAEFSQVSVDGTLGRLPIGITAIKVCVRS